MKASQMQEIQNGQTSGILDVKGSTIGQQGAANPNTKIAEWSNMI